MSLTNDPRDPGLKNILPNGQQEKYLVLYDEERTKGFVRPVYTRYIHLRCGGTTSMGLALSETYARDPKFYGGTFCCYCGSHFDLTNEDGNRTFHWLDARGERVANPENGGKPLGVGE